MKVLDISEIRGRGEVVTVLLEGIEEVHPGTIVEIMGVPREVRTVERMGDGDFVSPVVGLVLKCGGAKTRMNDLAALLRMAHCPQCGSSGVVPYREANGITDIPCQFCLDREEALKCM